MFRELRALPRKAQTFAQKLLNFEKAIDYLKGARDCLSGIGCTKHQSYLANYLLGAAYGFAQSQAFKALMYKSPTRWAAEVDLETGKIKKIGLGAKLLLLDLLVTELGYRYLVKDRVYLFRCLTFRGCTDQTKRYAFYRLGIMSGRLVTKLQLSIQSKRYMAAAERQRPQREYEERMREEHIEITDSEVKKTLGLDLGSKFFNWYEVFGFTATPTKRNREKKYRQLSRRYHPDKTRDVDKKELYTTIQGVLNAAHEKSEQRFVPSEPEYLALPAPEVH